MSNYWKEHRRAYEQGEFKTKRTTMILSLEQEARLEKRRQEMALEHEWNNTGKTKPGGPFGTLYIWVCTKCAKEQTSIGPNVVASRNDCGKL